VKGWARTSEGWALNLDGSDASGGITYPRLELRSSPRGWRSFWLLPDGTVREDACPTADDLVSAKARALDRWTASTSAGAVP
jgi:hypothetical protein